MTKGLIEEIMKRSKFKTIVIKIEIMKIYVNLNHKVTIEWIFWDK